MNDVRTATLWHLINKATFSGGTFVHRPIRAALKPAYLLSRYQYSRTQTPERAVLRAAGIDVQPNDLSTRIDPNGRRLGFDKVIPSITQIACRPVDQLSNARMNRVSATVVRVTQRELASPKALIILAMRLPVVLQLPVSGQIYAFAPA